MAIVVMGIAATVLLGRGGIRMHLLLLPLVLLRRVQPINDIVDNNNFTSAKLMSSTEDGIGSNKK
jgi:hypothetical protein